MFPTSLPGAILGGITAARPTSPRAARRSSVGVDATSSGVRPPSPAIGSSEQPSGTQITYFTAVSLAGWPGQPGIEARASRRLSTSTRGSHRGLRRSDQLSGTAPGHSLNTANSSPISSSSPSNESSPSTRTPTMISFTRSSPSVIPRSAGELSRFSVISSGVTASCNSSTPTPSTNDREKHSFYPSVIVPSSLVSAIASTYSSPASERVPPALSASSAQAIALVASRAKTISKRRIDAFSPHPSARPVRSDRSTLVRGHRPFDVGPDGPELGGQQVAARRSVEEVGQVGRHVGADSRGLLHRVGGLRRVGPGEAHHRQVAAAGPRPAAAPPGGGGGPGAGAGGGGGGD